MLQTVIPAEVVLRRPGGALIRPEGDGYIPDSLYGEKVRMLVLTSDPMSTCISVDKEKHIQEAPFLETRDGRLYDRWIEVPAPYEENHLRLVCVTLLGRVTMWEVAITLQGRDNFFLTTQLVYDTQCYRDSHGKAVAPLFSEPFVAKPWPELNTLVNNLASNRLEFPYITQFPGMPTSVPPPTDARNARVVWYSLARRLGMAQTVKDDKAIDAIILGREVPQNGSRLRSLRAGQIIRFDRLVPQDQGCPFRLEGLTLVA